MERIEKYLRDKINGIQLKMGMREKEVSRHASSFLIFVTGYLVVPLWR